MLKIMQIKVPKCTLVLQKHLSKCGLQITTKINHEQYKKSTALSKYILPLKEDQIMSRMRWSVVEKVYGRTEINFCPLCLAEKVDL